MTAIEIQKAVRRLFVHNDYHLFNQFVFKHNWESDYFSVTKSGKLIECEVKISRSDFFADFKKPKHRLLQALFDKKQHVVENLGPDYRGDLICHFKSGRLVIPGYRLSWNRRHYNHWMYTAYMAQETIRVTAPCTHIQIHQLQKLLLPHRFYYATPAGLISQEEVPPYAGLIQMEGEYSADYIKKAPILHKKELPPGFWKIILDKYYFKHRELITQP